MNHALNCLRTLLLGAGLLLGACGGGGDSREAAPAPPPAPATLRLEVLNRDQQLLFSQQDSTSNYIADFLFTVRDLSRGGEVYLQGKGSENAISGGEIFQIGREDFTLRLFLRAPSSLAVGDYLDTVTLSACLDPQCQRPIPGSPAILTLRSRVEAPPPPPPPPPRLLRQDLTGIRIQDLSSGFDYNDSVYVSLAEDSPVAAGSVARVRPNGQGDLDRLTLLPRLEQPPGALAHGYGMLYVAVPGTGRIERIRTDSNVRETTPITVGSTLFGQRLEALALATQGGETVAAIRTGADGSPHSIAYYRGAAIEGQSYGGNFLQPFDANILALNPTESSLVGLNTRQSDYSLHRFSLSGQGVSSEARVANVGAGAGERLVWSAYDNYLYSDRGRVYNPETGALLKQLDDPDLIATTLHPYRNRLISLSKGIGADETILRAYALDGSELRLVETVMIADLPKPRRLAPWGLDGVATIGDDGRLVRLYGPAVIGD